MLRSDKKAVSEMVSYVLLVVIAIGLSVIVYAYLKTYIPRPAPQCDEGVSLSIQDAHCEGDYLNITFLNKGYFQVHAVYVRFGDNNAKIRKELQGVNDSTFWLSEGVDKRGLLPGNSTPRVYDISDVRYASNGKTNFTIEIEPAIYNERGRLISCNHAVVIQRIICKD